VPFVATFLKLKKKNPQNKNHN